MREQKRTKRGMLVAVQMDEGPGPGADEDEDVGHRALGTGSGHGHWACDMGEWGEQQCAGGRAGGRVDG